MARRSIAPMLARIGIAGLALAARGDPRRRTVDVTTLACARARIPRSLCDVQRPPDDEYDTAYPRIDELLGLINNTPPASISDCVAKLRLLADLGMVGDREDDFVSLRRVIAFAERLAGT